jgi:hypothetical protein
MNRREANTVTTPFYRTISVINVELQNTAKILPKGNFYIAVFEATEHDKKWMHLYIRSLAHIREALVEKDEIVIMITR